MAKETLEQWRLDAHKSKSDNNVDQCNIAKINDLLDQVEQLGAHLDLAVRRRKDMSISINDLGRKNNRLHRSLGARVDGSMDKAIGGSDVCSTCEAHCIVLEEKSEEFDKLMKDNDALQESVVELNKQIITLEIVEEEMKEQFAKQAAEFQEQMLNLAMADQDE